MKSSHRLKFLFLLIVTLWAGQSFAQSEVERELSSLHGIGHFYFVVNVEGNKNLTKEEQLNVPKLQEQLHGHLQSKGMDVLPNTDKPAAAEVPYLRLHINAMDAGRGLVPFSISVNFYQPVKLVLNRDRQTLASTWNTGYVGIVSYDRMGAIDTAAVDMLDEFIQDYRRVNKE